jgi:type I restriction enzyme S subunit
VFTRDATIGLAAITTRPMAVSQHIIAWVCGPKILPEYLLFVFYAMTQDLERLTMGSTIKTIGMSDVFELITTVPPIEEQKKISDYIFIRKDNIDQIARKIQESITKLQEYRSAVISAAVTGKIDVQEGAKA